jgi:hypothetical protein
MFEMLRRRALLIWTALTIKPMAGGAEEGDGGDGNEGNGEEDGGKDAAGKDAGTGEEGDGKDDEPDEEPEGKDGQDAEALRKKLRQTERNSRREGQRKDKEIEKLRNQLKQREDADKTEQQKAVDEAREEGRKEIQEKVEAERRRDRLEVAATRLATRGVKIGKGDDAETVKFADPEDALVHLERAVRNGDVDDPFDDNGKVKTDDLQEALVELLERKPHLRADEPKKQERPGSADAGKGAGEAKGLDEMSTEEHFQRIKRHK